MQFPAKLSNTLSQIPFVPVLDLKQVGVPPFDIITKPSHETARRFDLSRTQKGKQKLKKEKNAHGAGHQMVYVDS